MKKFSHIIVGFICLLTGCTGGQWIKQGASPESVQKDYNECRTWATIQQPRPGTLGERIGANPDMSGQAIEKCMREKGYQWVTEKSGGS
ncbi:MAG: hypothetical protein R3351_07920 [Nitrospirales bacterium]|nr:hypothetical protein [Nitrospirales bacterium]